MNKKSSTKSLLLLILFLAVTARIFALFFVDSISHPATWEYEDIANNLLEGKGLYFTFLGIKYRATAMVLYPLICAAIYYFTQHSFLMVKIFQIIISLISCIVIYDIAKRLFGKRIGLITLALMSLHPGLIVFSVKLHALTLDVFLFTLSIYFLLFIIEGQKVMRNGFLAGLCIGLALLTRATIGLFIPVVLVMIFFNKKLYKKALYVTLSILSGILLILSPLLVRNYLVFGKVAVLPNESAFHFWIGNSAESIGVASAFSGKSVFGETAPESLRNKIKGLNEFEQKKLLYCETWNFIKSNPQRFIRLFINKLYYFWWFTPTQGLLYPKYWFIIYKLFYVFILIFAILGIFRGIKIIPRENRQMLYLVILFCATISIAQALYYVDGRHRWLVEPIILIFTACGINFLWLYKKRYKKQ